MTAPTRAYDLSIAGCIGFSFLNKRFVEPVARVTLLLDFEVEFWR